MAKCLHCNKLVISEGKKPKKYCNDVCRMRMKRDIAQVIKPTNEQANTRIETNTNKRTEPDNTVKGGVCWCCGNEIESILVCCGPCAWSGRAKAKRAGAAPPRIGVKVGAGPVLHPSIIAAIHRLTTNLDGTVDQQARTSRLAAAKSYQRMYPERTYTGI